MSIPMDVPVDHRAVVVLMANIGTAMAACNSGAGGSNGPRGDRGAMGTERRAMIRQQEGEIWAREYWPRDVHESRGVRRPGVVRRQERGHGAGVRAGLAFQRKRKALMAAMR